MTFIESREFEYRVKQFNVVLGDESNLALKSVDCTRTITRWSNGTEVLSNYTRHPTPRYTLGPVDDINHTTEGWRVNTQEELRHLFATDLFNHYDDGQGWNIVWGRIAELISAHVHAQGGGGSNFNIEVEVVVVDQAVADQNNPYWESYFEDEDHVTIANNQRIPDECPICYKSVADVHKRIGLECGHVYCKPCIYAWIWRTNDFPICRGEVHG